MFLGPTIYRRFMTVHTEIQPLKMRIHKYQMHMAKTEEGLGQL